MNLAFFCVTVPKLEHHLYQVHGLNLVLRQALTCCMGASLCAIVLSTQLANSSLALGFFELQILKNIASLRQPRPKGLLLVQNGGSENPWSRLPKWLETFVRILSRKHVEMSSFRLNNGFRLQKTNRVARRWKQPQKKPFHPESRDRILRDSWSISAALARGLSNVPF